MALSRTLLQNLELKQENKRSILLSFLNQNESEIQKEMKENPLFFLNFLSSEDQQLCLTNFLKEKKFLNEVKKSSIHKPSTIVKAAYDAGWTDEEILGFFDPHMKEFVEQIIKDLNSCESFNRRFLFG